MAITIESSTSNTAAGVTSFTLTVPSGVAVGDLLFVIVGNDESATGTEFSTSETGWTKIGESGNSTSDAFVGMFYKIAVSADLTNDVTINCSSSEDWVGYFLRITGHDPTTPIGNTGSNINSSSPGAHPSVTTTIDNSLCIGAVAWDGGDCFPFTTFAPWTEWGEIQRSSSSATSSMQVATSLKAVAGTVPAGNVTASSSDGNAGFSVVINPSPAVNVDATTDSLTLSTHSATVFLDTNTEVITNLETLTLTEYVSTVTNISEGVDGLVVEAYSSATNNSTSVTITPPTGITVGDLLVVFALARAGYASPNFSTLETGWTKYNEYTSTTYNTTVAVFYKVAVSGDSTNDVTIDSVDSRRLLAHYFRISGQDTSGFIHTVSQAYNTTNPYDIPSITSNRTNSLLLGASVCRNAATTYAVSGYTEQAEVSLDNDTSVSFYYDDTTGGAYSSGSITVAGADDSNTVVLAIRPPEISNTEVLAGVDNLVVTENTATISYDKDIQAGTVALSITEYTSTITSPTMVILVGEQTTTGGGTSQTSMDMTIPSEAVVGDLLVILAISENASSTPQFSTAETGWTKISEAGSTGSDSHVAAFYKLCEISDLTNTVTIDHITSDGLAGTYLAFRNVNHSDPVYGWGSVASSTSTTSHTLTVGASLQDNAYVVAFISIDSNFGSPWSVSGTGWTKQTEFASGTSASDADGVWASNYIETVGTAPTITFTSSASETSARAQFKINGIVSPLDVRTNTPQALTITEYTAAITLPFTPITANLILTEYPAQIFAEFPVLIASHTQSPSTTNSYNITIPSERQAGDLILVFFAYDGPSFFTITGTTSGYTTETSTSSVSTGRAERIMSRISDGTETTFNVTSNGSGSFGGYALVIRNVGGSTVGLVTDSSQTGSNTFTTSHSMGGLTTTKSNSMFVNFIHVLDNTTVSHDQGGNWLEIDNSSGGLRAYGAAYEIDTGTKSTISAWTTVDSVDSINHELAIRGPTNTQVTTVLDSLILTENAATVEVIIAVDANVDTLTLTEQTATVSFDIDIDTVVDSLTLTENTASVAYDREVSTVTDSLTLTENAANVALNVTVNTVVDALTLAENQATLTYDVNVTTSPDTLVITTYNSSVVYDRNVSTAVDVLTLTEQAASVAYDVNVDTNLDVLTITENAASLTFDVNVTTNPNINNVTTYPATLTFDREVTSVVDALILTENVQQVGLDQEVDTNLATLTVTTYSATVDAGVTVETNLATLTLTEYQATTALDKEVSTNLDTLVITENTSTITFDVNVGANVNALTITANTAAVQAGDNVVVVSTTDTLVLTEYASTIAVEAGLPWYKFQILGDGDAYDPLYGLYDETPQTYSEYLAEYKRRR